MVNPPTRPTLEVPGWIGNKPRFRINGQAGPDYSLYASTNLAHWEILMTTSSPTLPWYFTDTQATNFTERFYRVGIGP